MKFIFTIHLTLLFGAALNAQIPGGFAVSMEALEIPGIVGLHSFSFGVADGKWLVLGGRRDGLHARQPFNAFPSNMNNTEIFVIDPQSSQVWSSAMNQLPLSIQEQLQSTNTCFHQHGDTLYVAGGYAYSASAGDHITFPSLIALNVSEVIEDVILGSSTPEAFKQVTDSFFAVTGGRMVHEGNRLLIVGGHRFDGNYNPMGMPTYTQAYTNAVRSFIPIHLDGLLQFAGADSVIDEFHLHRRDYNLIPYGLPNGDDAFYISSGVFQPDVNLPYLYPVEISGNTINPRTEFSQFLSNYHCPTVSLFDGESTHSLFFGGMSQYYYQNGSMTQDNQVPFIRTISMYSRNSAGEYTESLLPIEMPGLKGAGAEFILNETLPQSEAGIIQINDLQQDTILLGYIYGGINSSQLNPFSSNQTSTTSASSVVYKVWLTRSSTSINKLPRTSNWHPLTIFPNPAKESIRLSLGQNVSEPTFFYLLDSNGKLADSGSCNLWEKQEGLFRYSLPSSIASQQLELIVITSDNNMWSCSFLKN